MAIGDEEIGEAVLIEVEGGGGPGPAGAGETVVGGGLRPGRAAVVEESVAESHSGTFGAPGLESGTFEAEGVESFGGGLGHAHEEEVETAVGVEIGEGMRHAEGAGIAEPGGGLVGEAAVTVVGVDLEAGEVAGDDEVEVTIAIEVREGSAVGASMAVRFQAGVAGDVGEASLTVVAEEEGGGAVVGVEVGGGHLAALIGSAVLAEEDIGVTIAVDVAAGDCLGVFQAVRGWPGGFRR